MNKKVHTKEEILSQLRAMIKLNEASLTELKNQKRARKETDAYLKNRNPVLSSLSDAYNPDYTIQHLDTAIQGKENIVSWAKKMLETYDRKDGK